MKSLKYNLFTLLMALLFMGTSATVYAQSNTAAYDAYNKAIKQASSGQYQAAIDTYLKAISLAKKMGSKGQKIVKKSKSALPRLYYQKALSLYKNFQKSPSVAGLNKAIDAFKTSVAKANKYGNSGIASQAKGVVNQLYYQKALLQYQQKDFKGAMASINTAIKRNAKNAKAYYQKALIIKELSSATTDDYLAAIDKTIEVAKSVGNNQVVRQAKESAASQLVYIGAQRIKDENYSGAISVLKKALNYNPESVNAYFRLAQAYNQQAEWNQALEYAKKALQYANGGVATKAKLYFAIGNAYKGLGKYSQACEAYSNADYGRFKRSVEHAMKYVLKCK